MLAVSPAELQNIELLAGFQPEELQQFAAQLDSQEYADGENIVVIGDETRALFLILSGRVEIELMGRIVETTFLAELGPQEVFGESTFFHAAAHHTTVRCIEATRLAVLQYSTYEAMLKSNSSVAYHLGANAAHILAARLQATDQWIRDVLDGDEQIHRHELRERFHTHFRPTFSTPTGFVGIGLNR
jgi:CRP/FNR family transcriptional regulator, cyclic AMP receptor protein